jgi:hypothetical protein
MVICFSRHLLSFAEDCKRDSKHLSALVVGRKLFFHPIAACSTMSNDMSSPQSLKIACPNCSGHVEFPAEMHGQIINCPHCDLSLALNVPGYQPALPPTLPPYEKPRSGYIKTKGETAGAGCLVELVGLVLLFFFPIGTIIGLAIMVVGHSMSRYPVCSECGIRLTGRRVKICPACKAQFR